MRSASAFTPELLNEVLVKCLCLILPGDEDVAALPEKLPTNVAARHRAAGAAAKAIKAAGWVGDVGYNQLMYPNEKDVRKLLSWAVAKLPRAEEGAGGAGGAGASTPGAALLRGFAAWLASGAGGGAGAGAGAASAAAVAATPAAAHAALEQLQRHAAAAARVGGAAAARGAREAAIAALRAAAEAEGAGVGAPQALPHPAGTTLALADPSALAGLPAKAAPSWEALLACAPPPGGAAPRRRFFPGCGLDARSSPFNRRAAFAVTVERRSGFARGGPAPPPSATVARALTEEEIAAAREEEVAALNARLEAAARAAEGLAACRSGLAGALPALRAALAALEEALGAAARGVALRAACLDMLPDAEAHLARLGGEIAASRASLDRLAKRWEGVRGPLAAAIGAEEAVGAANSARVAELLAAVAALRAEMGDMSAEAARKMEAGARMEAELARATREAAGGGAGGGEGGAAAAAAPTTRAAYSRMIMDIVRGIRKQSGEIARIVGDVRRVQLELAAVGDGLKRITSVATETLERAAKENLSNPAYREAFKQLLRLQDIFAQLVASVAAAGAAENDARDADNRIEQMAARNDRAATAQLRADIAAIKAENEALEKARGAA